MRKIIILIVLILNTIVLSAQSESVHKYNVIWNSPSTDASGQMPLGNGNIAAGVYAIENDALYLLLSKNDALTYNGDLFKTGRVRISFSPNPFVAGKKFKQTFDMQTGSIFIETDGVTILVWADANRPVYHIQVESENNIDVIAKPEFWKRNDGSQWNLTSEPIDNPTQDVLVERNNSLIWYYAVGDRSVYPTELKFYDVEEMQSEYPDPYRFNTFGNLLESPHLKLKKGQLEGNGKLFDIQIHAQSEQIADTEEWINKLEKQAAVKIDVKKDWIAHTKWWSQFWNKSWITITDNTLPLEEREIFNGEGYKKHREEKDKGALVAQSYNVFRYLMACQSRGQNQAKFNGGLFTQPLRFGANDNPWETEKMTFIKETDSFKISNEDYRDWGRRYTFQNQRLLNWPLFMSGDLELTLPFFNYYNNLLPIRKAITKAWFGHEGAYYRENIERTGGERDNGFLKNDSEFKPLKTEPGKNDGNGYYHSYYFTCGLETVAMMLEYANYSQDKKFINETLTPFAREILLFFDKHYERDENGKLKLDPAMVLETFWIAVNPAPDIAGLHYCVNGMLELNIGTKNDRKNWKRFKNELPPVPLHDIDGKTAIAPAEEYSQNRNYENGELYPVFPFNLYGLGYGTEDIVKWTMKHRTTVSQNNSCWTQDQIHYAYAGNAKEAQAGLINRFSHASTQCRFPLYGVRIPDSNPDFDHFGSGSIALQRMLVQETGNKIQLLPAWPSNWDVDFKLHISKQTTITGKVVNGKLLEWNISPEYRKKDVHFYDMQH